MRITSGFLMTVGLLYANPANSQGPDGFMCGCCLDGHFGGFYSTYCYCMACIPPSVPPGTAIRDDY